MRKIVVLVLAISVVLAIFYWRFGSGINLGTKQSNDGQITLKYWGWYNEDIVKPLIESYEKTHPKIKIEYTKQSPINYRTRVQTQIRSDQGPDIFPIHNSWLSTLKFDLLPAPAPILSLEQFQRTFYPVAKDSLTINSKVYGVPYEMDGLAMYINNDIFRKNGVNIPAKWVDLIEVAKMVKVVDAGGQIQIAGAGVGGVDNVDYWPEIISLLFLQQPKANLESPATAEGAEVLKFYTNFVTDPQSKVWDVNLPPSTKLFSDGKLAIYFGPLKQYQVIKANNPSLDFKIFPMPQLPGQDVALASFWAYAVSAKSANPSQSWDFMKFLVSEESLKMLNQQLVQSGNSGFAYPRIAMAKLQQQDPVFGAFVVQAPFYKSWYLNSDFKDAGINEEMIAQYKIALDSVLKGQDSLQALQTISTEVKKILEKYTR